MRAARAVGVALAAGWLAVAGPAAALPDGLALDGSGTLRLDGGGPAPEDGAVATVLAALGPRPIPEARHDEILGIGVLARPLPALELGLSFPRLTRRSQLLEGPIIEPGLARLDARTAVIPELRGFAVSGFAALPMNPIAGVSPSRRAGGRLAWGREVGPVRPLVNLGLEWSADETRDLWGGVGLRFDLPLGVQLRLDGEAGLDAAWRGGAGLAIPVGPGADLVADLARLAPAGGEAPQLVGGVALVLRTSATGPGAPFRYDRDGDGVLNAEDACPRTWGDGPDGCPSPVAGLSGCNCPLLDMSVFELERLVASLAAVPDGDIYLVEVRVRPSGDLALDWEQTRLAVEGTRAALLDLGVPPGNFAVIGRPPLAVEGVPLITVREFPIWKAPAYIEAAEFKKPSP